MNTDRHHHYMLKALQLAERGRYSVSPNPMVGCVIVKNDCIVGEGFHLLAGSDHAEIIALKAAGESASGATVYVTLEPCPHQGATPPCTDALIAAKVKKVIIACQDPHTKVAGKGIAVLIAAGIEVIVGVNEEAARALNARFFHFITQRMPFVIAKWAMSLDGLTQTHVKDSRIISSPASHLDAHHLRHEVDAILVGANTARLDNPQLTTRLPNVKRQPLRIVLTMQSRLRPNLHLFQTPEEARTLVVTTPGNEPYYRALQLKGVEILSGPLDAAGKIDLIQFLKILGKRGISSLLIEGGRMTQESFFAEHLVNKVQVYVAPVIIASLSQKKPLINFSATQMGADVCFTGNIEGSHYV
ncbi:MAG: bifunctional diaminohydroxyphosphoribosylaminopyrimidine deaminase/5-amino-6-(5-phosphoribosylamino)uracil reductase RibD [Gammaproteobacteria bacterium]|nr:bifunctional diaminohydroxyphosphoribosylaminopyrimidine deaminase/5-amino-6-(5-phosphoribosylamino)uracil reductase RibD [Gammaproteobacteria bacterium]